MRRVHAVTPQSSQIMFVDATGSLDRLNHQILKLMTESPVGGLPLGFIILSEQTESSLSEGFVEIKKIFPQGAFLGRGILEGPQVIMTDDDSVCIYFHFIIYIYQYYWPAPDDPQRIRVASVFELFICSLFSACLQIF